MKNLVFCLIALFISFQTVKSQEPDSTVIEAYQGDTNAHDHRMHNDHDHHDHIHQHNWELGFAGGLVRLISEKENAPGFHLHVLRNIGKSGKFSMGPGLEFIADEHKHLGAVLSFGYRPIHPLYLGISPGVALPVDSHDEHSEPAFSTHFETLYEFELEHFHLGPMMEYSWSAEDRHFMVGLHLGLHF